MKAALEEAKKGFNNDEVPVGAVIVLDGKIISSAHNEVESRLDATAHAEMLCIWDASKKLGKKFLTNTSIYVTLEPCAMCAQAISLARISKIYFGAYDKKFGALENGCKVLVNANAIFKPEVYGGIMEDDSALMLKNFFSIKRPGIQK